MRLRSAEIDRYGPLRDCRPTHEDGLTVLSGPNEAGKTLYLEALLRLLEPEVADVLDPEIRVEAEPAGRVVLEHDGDRFEFPGEATLSEVSEIEPAHLQSVFIVRDNDLALPREQEYYTSLIEKLGDIHTTEIDAIQAALKERGRLTDRRLNISSDQSVDNAGGVRDDAASLASEIREYTETIDAEGLDELETRQLRLKRELQDVRDDLATQERRQTAAEYERLSDQLDAYREMAESLAELEDYDRERLEELRDLEGEIASDRQELGNVEQELEETRAKVSRTEGPLVEYEDELAELEPREGDVEEARDSLESLPNQRQGAKGADDRRTVAKYATVAGLLGAGMAGAAGAVTGSLPAFGLGAALLVVALIGGVVYRSATQDLVAAESAREAVLETARDAGLEVESVEDVAPQVTAFETDLDRVRGNVNETRGTLEAHRDRLDDLDEKREGLDSAIEGQRAELADALEAAGVESVEEFADRVEQREELESDQRPARQSLVDAFGDPGTGDVDEQVAAWEEDLEAMVADLDLGSVDAEAFAEDELQRLSQRVDELEDELAGLDQRLGDHQDRLDEFDRQASRIRTEPFVGEAVELATRTRQGLESLAGRLEQVVHRIEADADLSRKALAVFDALESREEQKLTELFDPDGPASETFSRLTGGRYTEVDYDPDSHDLQVERGDGRTFGPTVLSQGTTDQLYFATRVSLAQQLLGSEPGFLLLDDPFLAADPERLTCGFESLVELADRGWQILYCTAKEEVSVQMVTEFDLVHSEIESP